jgi:hypothetical protein
LAGTKAKPGESVAAIAQKHKTDPQKIIDLNPKLSPSSPLPPGTDVTVPIPIPIPIPPPPPSKPTPAPPSAPAVPPSEPPKPVTDSKPDKFGFWFGRNILDRFSRAVLPPAPQLEVKQVGCFVELTITKKPRSNEEGFFIYYYSGPSFKRVATVPSTGLSLSFVYKHAPILGGPAEYYVSAYNAAGERPSNIAGMFTMGDSSCKSESKTIGWDKVELTTTTPIQKIYCYLTVNGGPARRIPEVPDTFLLRKKGVFDVSEYLKTIGPVPKGSLVMELECWGWDDGKLVPLGKAKRTIDYTKKPFEISGDRLKMTGEIGLDLSTPLRGFSPDIVVPVNFKATSDPKTCAAHVTLFGALFCEAAIKEGKLVLVWDPKPSWLTECPAELICDVDGYQVYRVGPGKKYSAARAPATAKGWTQKTLPWPKSTPACYVVRAYKGDWESGDSNEYCVSGSPSGVSSAVLRQSDMVFVESWVANKSEKSDKIYCKSFTWVLEKFLVAAIPVAGPIMVFAPSFDASGLAVAWKILERGRPTVAVGYDNHYDAGTEPFPCPELADNAYRGAIAFSFSPLRTGITKDAYVSRATLKYRNLVDQIQWHFDDYRPAEGESCMGELWTGIREGAEINSIDRFTSLAGKPGTEMSVDVTNVVQEWIRGESAEGVFIFVGLDESFARNNNICISRLGNFELDIEYFPGP